MEQKIRIIWLKPKVIFQLVMDTGLYLEYEKDFNANFKELSRERDSSTIGHNSDHNTNSHNSYHYRRTTPYVPGFNVKMGNISKNVRLCETFIIDHVFQMLPREKHIAPEMDLKPLIRH